MHRLFVAIELPQHARDALSRLQGGSPGIRWSSDDQMHLTLRFIGNVDGPTLNEIATGLAHLEGASFTLALEGVGHFPPRGKAKTLWAGVEPSPGLIRLRDAVEGALVGMGFEPERRTYVPHVTIARSSGGIRPEPLAEFLMANALFRSQPFVVSSFALFSSHLSHDGAQYTVEAEYSLIDQIEDS